MSRQRKRVWMCAWTLWLSFAGIGAASPPESGVSGASPAPPAVRDTAVLSPREITEGIAAIKAEARGDVLIVDCHGYYDYDTVQGAIDGAAEGDTVVVLPNTCTGEGVYFENLDFLGKAITVQSLIPTDPAVVEATVIDGNESGSVVTFQTGETAASTLNGVTITNGLASSGGGIHCDASSPTITNCVITQNEAGIYDRYGGGIFCENGNPTITNCTITHNTADWGGGIFCDNGSPTITNCTITHNTADCGGGIYCMYSSPTITDCLITQNEVDLYSGGGGGICCTYSSPTITNCTITQNTARGPGGGICCAYGSPTITNCTITQNTASNVYGSGGGISCHGGSPTIANCAITRNTAEVGGGISCDWCTNATITDCVITQNETALHGSDGGGIWCSDSSLTITNCTISQNTAYGMGGGICCQWDDPTITNCTITQNTASWGGGICCWELGNATITNCTITQNTASSAGGGIMCLEDSSPEMINCILWANAAAQGSEIALGARFDPAGSSSLTVSYSVVQGGEAEVWVGEDCALYWGDGNLEDHPLLTRAGDHLQANSPCHDAGDPGGDYTGQTDIDGEPRVVNGNVDIGADEFLDIDADGLPDWWELLHFGSATAGDPLADDDGDGLINLDEYALSRNPLQPRRTWYVNVAGDDDWDGLSPVWDGEHGPKETIQAAIDAAEPLEGDDIVVADGTYTGVGNKNLDFLGKEILVRSANGPDTCIIDCEGDGRGVHFRNWEREASTLNGLTIINGHAEKGGGISCDHYTAPTIDNCTITQNTANGGGGIYCHPGSSPTITNCTITQNAAVYGGGICFYAYASPTITNCAITQNTAENRGGGIYSGYSSHPTIANCSIMQNATNGYGGGIYSNDYSVAITNCMISGNTAGENGGGIHSNSYIEAITNCTITQNTANGDGSGIWCHGHTAAISNCMISGNTAGEDGGGVHADDALVVTNCTIGTNSANTGGGIYGHDVRVTSCVLWGNTDSTGTHESAQLYGASPDIDYSCVQGWTGQMGGAGNIDADPLFVDSDGPDDDPDTWDDNDYHLSAGSPCIDAGSNGALPPDAADLNTNGDTDELIPFDLDGNPRVIDGGWDLQAIVDMGAYEYQADCNDNGVYDRDDIAAGTSDDCNTNGFADECELQGGDCNSNGVPDECDLLGGHDCCDTTHGPGCSNPAIRDCVCAIDPYCCEVYWDRLCVEEMADEGCFNCQVDNDCNTNSIPDECDISAGTSADTDTNGIPDECEGCPYIYDLDGSCFVDAADLGLFAACWLLSDGEDGWDENECADKDFDCSGTVDATDLGLFAGAWLKSSDEFNPADYPECRACEGEIVCAPPGTHENTPDGKVKMGNCVEGFRGAG